MKTNIMDIQIKGVADWNGNFIVSWAAYLDGENHLSGLKYQVTDVDSDLQVYSDDASHESYMGRFDIEGLDIIVDADPLKVQNPVAAIIDEKGIRVIFK